MRNSIFVLVCGIIWSSSTATSRLSDAFNAALMQVQRTKSFDVQSIENRGVVVFCNPEGQWQFPESDADSEPEIAEVLERGHVRVSGLEADWGPDGDYTVQPPTGYWPDYLREIVKRFGDNYGIDLGIEYKHYPTSNGGLAAVENGDCDFTDVYFMTSGIYEDGVTRVTRHENSCITAGSRNLLLTTTTSPLETLDDVIRHLAADGGDIGVLSTANQHILMPILPSSGVQYHIYPHDDDLSQAIIDEVIDAGFTTGTFHNMTGLKSETTSIIALHQSFFAKSSTTEIPPSNAAGFLRIGVACGSLLFLSLF